MAIYRQLFGRKHELSRCAAVVFEKLSLFLRHDAQKRSVLKVDSVPAEHAKFLPAVTGWVDFRNENSNLRVLRPAQEKQIIAARLAPVLALEVSSDCARNSTLFQYAFRQGIQVDMVTASRPSIGVRNEEVR